MKNIWIRLLLLLVLTASPFLAPGKADARNLDGWMMVAPGVDYQEFFLPVPAHVFVARMDRSNPDMTIESSLGQGILSGFGYETVQNMAQRYDQAINYWGDINNRSDNYWGARNHVLAAINGSFVDPVLGIPDRGIVNSGWYAKRFTDNQNGSGFLWQLDRQAAIGQCVNNLPANQFIELLKNGSQYKIDDINVPRPAVDSTHPGALILYTPQYDRDTKTDDNGLEIVVEMNKPTLILSNPASLPTGVVRAVLNNQGSTPIPYDAIVISADGTAQVKLNGANIQIGDQIAVSQEISNCGFVPPAERVDWTKTYASVGGSFNFLKDGVIQDFLNNSGAIFRQPRTAIAFNDSYIFFIVVDGRDPYNSEGLTTHELAVFSKDTLGATWGIEQDGGGSSTMVINDRVVNNTFCNNSNCLYKIFMPVVSQNNPQAALHVPRGVDAGLPRLPRAFSRTDRKRTASIQALNTASQRAVIDGMLMVAVEPITRSLTLTNGLQVQTTVASNVRLGPGTNYAVLESVPAQTAGVVVADANHLEGVLAKGIYWWKVDFKVNAQDVIGWISQDLLEKIQP
jgi:Phosphodiester glycosidase